ncbi:tRNA uridine-5-carboxymethylaminomethyl(34) synthesis GTPase MnmE [Veillonella caviae]|uniref:tRNA uridine-5-carboxymethylaminomethyl(34) synthesis GTPase MnmE n=1 Tax=Veillonella caviae TaxID=248316 RepID=UPI0023A79F82|nr:tRNA uridine-5-carboxymethylaminomethyl(34) synthesis GTPase MnmE [Veillonella caviae]MCI5709294.1 tRNA uridine-5-carboxymethylaminomethyl(34) synthesis GTPase MnmE [Veillonella caviae]MDY5714712.1 tRNA uridine-5-carboxymethylaminomethyl(34) synthesis GTPase MnmE [Veillonella caviae]
MYIDDTIAAIATPPGIGGVGIIRVSGKDSFAIVNTLFKSAGTVPLGERPNRTIQYGTIVDPRSNKTIDEVLLLLMHGPHSYTAEDVVEIQCHGGIVPVRQILKLLVNQGVRMAEAGEFTKRAFMKGRIDLTQAEAIIDIIEAKTEDSLSLAVAQLDGTVSKFVSDVREQLIAMIAHLEVTIDYPEEDIEDVTSQEVREQLEPILTHMDELLATANTGRLIRDGIMTVIVGRPNAGKSSLMNALLRENRAIVTDIPGTTRDSIEEFMTIEGISLRLIDTAGIRDTDDTVEALGVERARQYIDKADIVLCVIDASTPLTDEERHILVSVSGLNTIVLLNKSDMGLAVSSESIASMGTFTAIETISAKDGEGTAVLSKWVKELVYGGQVKQTNDAMISNVRHISLMEQAKGQIEQAITSIDAGMPVDFIATDLRSAWELLGDITGDSIRESMVDELFSRFCLGK